MAPGAQGPPEHVHPVQEERFEVLAGRVGARLEGVERLLAAGQKLTVPAGTRHTWWAASPEETRVRVEFEPALETEGFFETLFGLAREGKVGANGQLHPLQMAVLLAGGHRGEMYLARPPILVQRAFAAIAAPIGRLLGYRDRYPEYGSS
jgi:hypothetical protein